MAWVFLAAAIGAELGGTLGLRAAADSLTWWRLLLIVAAYAVSFSCMGLALRQLNVGVVYAIWSAVGTAAISLLGLALFGVRLNRQAMAGLVLVVLGVAVLVTSGSIRHD